MTVDGAALPVRGWTLPLYCHVPRDEEVALDALAETADSTDRWNHPGEPTAYLASDAGAVLVELGRHLPSGDLGAPRRLLRLDPQPGALARLVDLRDRSVLARLGLGPDPGQFLDRDHACEVAGRVRANPLHQGLIVASMGLLDATDRCNVVVFADRISGGMTAAIRGWTSLGELSPGEGGVAG